VILGNLGPSADPYFLQSSTRRNADWQTADSGINLLLYGLGPLDRTQVIRAAFYH
jgi:hypothetical protein